MMRQLFFISLGRLKAFSLLSMLCLVLMPAWGQTDMEHKPPGKAEARKYLQEGNYEKAIPLLKNLFEQSPFDKALYHDYFEALLNAKQFDAADSLVNYMQQVRRGDPVMLIDLGRIELAKKHKRKAKKYFDEVLEQLPQNEFQIRGVAEAFDNADLVDYAIQTYLKVREVIKNPYLFAPELSLLYLRKGDNQGAIDAILDKAMTQINIMDEVQESLIQIISKDKDGLTLVRKALTQRVKENPKTPVWQQLISWTIALDGNYEQAFKELTQLNKTVEESGERLLPFARGASDAGAYEIADRAYQYVLHQKGSDQLVQSARAGELENLLKELTHQFPPEKALVTRILPKFKQFFEDYPQYRHHELWRQYAMVEARYNNRADTAIALLEQVSNVSKMTPFVGKCKLDMGDYYLLSGQIWNATLMYRQVNKAFEQDELGELARFKNAKWAFYKGDFFLAQNQLSVLKASTSKLISNDALYLSVLITENIPPDSNLLPLKKYAEADLLLFKNQPDAADKLLDSISKAWPQTPLRDDILMLRGQTAMAKNDWKGALQFFELVLKDYGDDVLGDDAAWQIAELYRKILHQPEKAAEYYKQIIIDYPGSTFSQEARRWYRELSSKSANQGV